MHYLTLQDILFYHDTLLQEYGGLGGVHNAGQIESILEHIQIDEYYPTLVDKSAHLFFGMIQFHPFNDGNKRTAVMVLYAFLFSNDILTEDFVIKLEDIAIGVAKWELSKDDVKKILRSIFISFGYSPDR